MPPIGTEKPSLLMANMLALVLEGDQVGTWFLALFLRRLLEWMRRQLEAGGHTTPDKLAVAATKLWEDRSNTIAPVQPASNKGGHISNKQRSQSKSGKSNWRQRSPSHSPSPRCRHPSPWHLPYPPSQSGQL